MFSLRLFFSAFGSCKCELKVRNMRQFSELK